MHFLDANSTTPLSPEVRSAMEPWLSGAQFGNASSSHAAGRAAKNAIEDARERISRALCVPRGGEIIFTSGATEANNLALFGLVKPSAALWLSMLEHSCIIEPAKVLEKQGQNVCWLPVDGQGRLAELSTELPEPRFLALQLVNHETGAIQPVQGRQAWLKQHRPNALLHVDAAQAVGKIPVSFTALGADSMSISGHKLHGPAGVGALIHTKRATPKPLFYGGHQEQGRRAGTESVALIVGLATAVELAVKRQPVVKAEMQRIQVGLWDALQKEAGPCVRNTPLEGASPYVLNVSFPGCRADLLLMKLDQLGVCCSTGSACSSGSLLPSPVLQAMGVPEEVLRSAMRFSWPSTFSWEAMQPIVPIIVEAVKQVRS
jgi:cysteine desulfurase